MRRQDSATLNRRRLLALLGSSSALALAGCSDDTDTGGDGDGEPTATATDTPEPLQAVAVPEDSECAVCKMMPAKFPDWNAQAVHADDTRAFFCTSGCATTYFAVPEEFADTDADIDGLWVRDLESTDLVDGTAAWFALETDSDRLDDPMNLNPVPFENREDAVDYVDEVGYLEESDVVELSAFDRDLAEQYRGKMLE